MMNIFNIYTAYKRSLFSVLVFVYMFAYGIKLFGIPVSVFMMLISVAYIAYSGLIPRFLKVWRIEILLIFIIFIYLLNIEIFLGSGFSSQHFAIYVIRILLDGFLPAFVLSDIARKQKIDLSDFVSSLILIVVVEFVLSSIMLVSPALKNFIFTYVNDVSDKSVLMSEHIFLLRGFGLAYTYFAWFPFSLALIFIFVLYSNVIRSRILLSLFFLATIIQILINARIGFVPIVVGTLIYILFGGSRAVKNTLIIVAVIISISCLLSLFDVGYETQARIDFIKKWVLDEGFSSLLDSDENVTLRDLSNFKILTSFSFFDFLFGRGDIISPDNNKDLYTDVGYLQILYTGGLMLSGSLYALFGLFAKRLFDATRVLCVDSVIPTIYLYFPLVISVSLLIGHGKLRIFEINEATRFLFLLVSFFSILAADHAREKTRALVPNAEY